MPKSGKIKFKNSIGFPGDVLSSSVINTPSSGGYKKRFGMLFFIQKPGAIETGLLGDTFDRDHQKKN
jgi:hypothetical protein